MCVCGVQWHVGPSDSPFTPMFYEGGLLDGVIFNLGMAALLDFPASACPPSCM